MDETEVNMTNLFLQLGLDASEQAIAEFIKTHQLPTELHIVDADYWSAGQKQFLGEQLTADAPWALIVDHLSESLHADAINRHPASA